MIPALMRIYSFSLSVAATEAYAPADVLARLQAALATFEAERSDEHPPHHMLSVKATLVYVEEQHTGTLDPTAWRSLAMQRLGKMSGDDVIANRPAE